MSLNTTCQCPRNWPKQPQLSTSITLDSGWYFSKRSCKENWVEWAGIRFEGANKEDRPQWSDNNTRLSGSHRSEEKKTKELAFFSLHSGIPIKDTVWKRIRNSTNSVNNSKVQNFQQPASTGLWTGLANNDRLDNHGSGEGFGFEPLQLFKRQLHDNTPKVESTLQGTNISQPWEVRKIIDSNRCLG